MRFRAEPPLPSPQCLALWSVPQVSLSCTPVFCDALFQCYFKRYNEQVTQHPQLVFDEGDVADRITEFKEATIWPHVVQQVCACGCFLVLASLSL